MTSTLILYYKSLVNADKNFALDNPAVNDKTAIENYLSTLSSTTISNFQYIKHQLTLSIKINASQAGLIMGSAAAQDMNYCKIQNGTENPMYYFIIKKNWRAQETIELVLLMDTLNSFKYGYDYILNAKTMVKRQHKDRFIKKVVTSTGLFYVNSVEQIEDVLMGNTFTTWKFSTLGGNADLVGATILSSNVVIAPQSGISLTISIAGITIDADGNITFRSTPIAGSFQALTFSSDVTLQYRVNKYYRVIDLKSEEINVPTYKASEETLFENRGKSTIDWALYYKNSTNQQDSPIDCYLVPSNALSLYVQQQSGALTTSNVPTGKYLTFFASYNDNISLSVDGVNYTPSYKVDIINVTHIVAIAIYNTGTKLEVYEAKIANYDGYNGGWVKVADNPNDVHVVNSPATINAYEVNALPTANQIFNNAIYLAAYVNKTINMGALVQSTMYGNNSIDKTLATNVKIINIPYSPTSFSVDNNFIYTFASCWTYFSNDGKLKLTNFDVRFSNNVESQAHDIFDECILRFTSTQLAGQENRFIKDSKLFHSDYYRPKFVHDSFAKVFPLEQIEIQESAFFSFKFVMSRNIVSKFLFMFDYTWNHSTEDYPNILAVSRNNEEVLYNSQYLDYIRTGYNYDLKSKARQQTASGIGLGLNIASLLATGVIGAATGNPLAITGAVASGIGLVSQIVSFAKSTAENEQNIQRKLQETQMQAVSVMNADDYDLLYAYSENKAKLCYYKTSPQMERILDDLFYYGGYAVNEQMLPDITSRYWFNFVQASIIIEESNNLNADIENDLKERFENGVTFLHYRSGSFDMGQTKENLETWMIGGN